MNLRKEYDHAYYIAHREKRLAQVKAYRASGYKSPRNLETERAQRERRTFASRAKAAERQRRFSIPPRQMPGWADHDAILEVYERAQAWTVVTGIRFSVDHELPIRGEFVSGLHVHQNLQVIPLNANFAKHKQSFLHRTSSMA